MLGNWRIRTVFGSKQAFRMSLLVAVEATPNHLQPAPAATTVLALRCVSKYVASEASETDAAFDLRNLAVLHTSFMIGSCF